jgi:DNA polymerase-3 subunit delta'
MARAPAVQEIEEFPEQDRIEGFPHPRETQRLFGHERAERTLAQAFGSGRMHHAWLLAGPEGVGKATLAYKFARFALGERDMLSRAAADSLDVPEDSTAARLVRARSHPNLLVLRRAYDIKTKRFPATIPVDEVRRLKGFLSLMAGEGAWRVVIVDKADELNVSAANALLKSLEEPPARTVFLLVSAAPGRLLTTIRSRCRTLELAALGGEDLKRAVAQAMTGSGEDIAASAPQPSEWPRLERLAGGSVRRALALHAARGLELHDRIATLISSLPKLDWTAVHTLSDELAGAAAEQRFELFYELLLEHLSQLVRVKVSGAGPPDEIALAGRLIDDGAGLATWAALWERMAAEKADAAALNLDRKALILDAFFRLETASRH